MTFRISVPGKIHLLGEHTVVYGKPALFSAINLRVTLTISSSKNTDIENLQDKENLYTPLLQKTIEEIIKKKFKIKIPNYRLEINSQIPIGAGLGSSAAISSGYIAVLLSFIKIKWNKELINELTYLAEKKFHGNPSGGDNTAVIYGGFLWYRKELEFLKVFQPIPHKIHAKIQKFLLINSGRPLENTAEMVSRVRIKKQKSRIKVKRIFEEQEELTKQLLIALVDGEEELLIGCIKKGERNLEYLGVVGKKSKKIIKDIENLGGAAKILGGGGVKDGSGMILAYSKNIKKLQTFAKENNLEGVLIELGEEGLKIE